MGIKVNGISVAGVGSPGPQGPRGYKGDQGEAGAAATIQIGTVSTGVPGSQVQVTNSGTASAAILNFTIPKGADGSGSTIAVTTNTTAPKLYVLGTTNTSGSVTSVQYNANVYMDCANGVLMGAAWNDYAEYREANTTEPGRVICENGDDTLSIAQERLQPGASIISDTFGFAIGKTENAQTPVAVSGRVLVYTYEERESFRPGDAVCAAPGGTVSKMSREEIMTYPERIIGTVSAIPAYEVWGEKQVPVNNRIWIKVR